MAQRRDPADHLAGRGTYEVGIGPFERWQVLLGADLLYVDAMGTGSQNEDRCAFGIENEAVGNSADPDAEGGRCLTQRGLRRRQRPPSASGSALLPTASFSMPKAQRSSFWLPVPIASTYKRSAPSRTCHRSNGPMPTS